MPYLAGLGISHLYASPLFTARRGSSHGYDVVDYGAINPELGGRAGLERLAETLHRHGMGLLLDIVPNHMAADAVENPWWRDVLARGRTSPYAKFFDIDWSAPEPWLRGKILLPVLGRPYAEALAAGEIRRERDAAGAGGEIVYFEHRFPLAPGTEAMAASRADMHALLEAQHYRLAWWRTAADALNWRRFFDINALVALRAERPEVFAATHGLVLELFAAGLIDGVRVDHVDGLADPGAYCRRLRRAFTLAYPPRRAYIVVEKILAPGEGLPADWPVDGTTGYDFMAEVSGLLHDPAGEEKLTRLWARIVGGETRFAAVERRARAEVTERLFTAELRRAVKALVQAAGSSPGARDFPAAAIGRAIAAVASHFPVYRLYPGGQTDPLKQALGAAGQTLARADRHWLERLGEMLAVPAQAKAGAHSRRAQIRFQLLTSPLAAKAVEDTAFYRYGRLLSRNEVGACPGLFAVTAEEFHAAALARQASFPDAMLATATHDQKRGEDVRARLAVLSEIPTEWAAVAESWMRRNNQRRRILTSGPAPASSDELMLYQMLVGAWPALLDVVDENAVAGFAERLARWQEKALREAKRRSDWAEPDTEYESACRDFLVGMLADPALREDVAGFAARIGPAGAINGLAQTILRLTVPGVPDLYQGCEFWDESLVDPDNRRPVDFAARREAFARASPMPDLLRSWRSGHVKQALILRLLSLRANFPRLFSAGSYEAIDVAGARSRHVLAFLRSDGATRLIVAVARLSLPLLGSAAEPVIDPAAWEDTELQVPLPLTGPWHNALVPNDVLEIGQRLPAAAAFRGLPVACWLGGEGAKGLRI